jgi:pimeloyl-ACP methyl ester carboxylesterase
LTRRHVGKGLLTLSTLLLPRRSGAEEAPRPNKSRSEAKKQAHAAKPWLQLPPTPRLPPASRSDTVAVNGTRIWFAQFGAGPPVLFLHGGLGSSNYWGHQVQALAENFTVIVMDTRGHGRSPVTSDKFGFAVFADDVAALLDFLGIPSASIVGWSDGAITGLQLAMTRPKLVSGLFAFGANSTTGGLKPGGSRSRVFASYAARCKSEYAQLSPEPERWRQLLKGLGAMWRREPNFTRAALATITAPTTIADGEQDEIIRREDTELMARAIPGAKLVILPGVSHFAMLQKPAEFNKALVEFLPG